MVKEVQLGKEIDEIARSRNTERRKEMEEVKHAVD